LLGSSKPALCAVILVSAVVVYVPLVFGLGSDELRNNGREMLQDPLFESLTRITLVLCCPMLFAVIADILFCPGYRWSWEFSVRTYRMWLTLVFLLPSAGMYAFCFHPPFPGLAQVLYQTQFILIMYPTLLLLNQHDTHIWTNEKSFSIVFLHCLSRICWVMYYYGSIEDAEVAGICCRLIAACIGVPCCFRWLHEHWAVIVNVIMLRSIHDERLSHDRILSIFYVAVVIALGLASLGEVISGAYTIVGGRCRGFSQIVGLAVVVLIPGRLAIRDVVRSDVRSIVLSLPFLCL
jgi:hypothetical protein